MIITKFELQRTTVLLINELHSKNSHWKTCWAASSQVYDAGGGGAENPTQKLIHFYLLFSGRIIFLIF